MPSYHNIERALRSKPYDYRAWNKAGAAYTIRKPLARNLKWFAYKLNIHEKGSYSICADTMRELSTKLAADC